MPKVTITSIENLTSETSALERMNANFVALQSALDEVLFRDGDGATSDNQMVVDLDMNSNRILNLPWPEDDLEPARHGDTKDLRDAIDGAQVAQAAAEVAQAATEEDAEHVAFVFEVLFPHVYSNGSLVVSDGDTVTHINKSFILTQEFTRAIYDDFLALYNKQYDVSFFIQGTLVENEEAFHITFSRKTEFPVGLSGSYFKAGTDATGTATSLSLSKNGTAIGSIDFAVDTSVATYTFEDAIIFEVGDTLEIAAPASVDTALADISGTLRGTRLS